MKFDTLSIEEFRKEQKTFDSTDGRIGFIDEGEGQVILLLHGIPTSSWLYRKMIDNLVNEGFRVVVPDMLGFGNSDNPNGYELYSSKNHSKRIIELMDSLSVDSWSHLMHDAGGLWTWELIKNYPNRISNIIILNTLILKEGFYPPMKMKEGFVARFILSLYSKKITSTILLKFLFKNGLSNITLSKKEFDGYQLPMLEGKTNGMYYFFTQLSNPFPNYEKMFKTLDIPILLIWGKDDKILKWNTQNEKAMELLNINSKNIHILDANHFLQEEEPTTLVNLIIEFLNK